MTINKLKHKVKQISPWFILFIASFLLFYKYLLQVFPTVITDELMRTFQLTGAGLGNLAACFFYSYLIIQFFSGYLIDRFNLKYIISSSIFISAMGVILFSQGSSFSLAVFGRVLMGAGAAFATVGYMKIAAVYFSPRYFSLVSGLLTVGVMLGAVFGEAPLAHLISATGWQQALKFIGYAGILISLLYLVCIRNNANKTSAQAPPTIRLADLKKMLLTPTNWYLTLYSGLAFAPLAVFGGLWGTPYIIKAYNLSNPEAAFIVSFVYMGFGLGGPLLGLFADRFQQRFALMRISLLLSLIGIISIIYLTPSLPMLIPLTFLFGFGTGGFMLGFAVGKDMNPLFMTATVVALINSGDAICGAFSEPLIGKILDLFNSGAHTLPAHFQLHSYRTAFFILPIEILLAYFFLFLTKRSIAKRKEKIIHSETSDPILNHP